jgi:thiaminase/transcriptional activator TenA
MRNPRSIFSDNFSTNQFIEEFNLSSDEPPQNSLFWKMWKSSLQSATKALDTNFIQGIKSGILDPNKFGAFYISNSYYCFNGADSYYEAEKRAEDLVLKSFLWRKYDNYNQYNQTFPDRWNLKNWESVMPTQVCKEYSEFEKRIAQELDPIYCIIVMLPCEYLWSWLAKQIGSLDPNNVYRSWPEENRHFSGAFAMGNFIEGYSQDYPGSIQEDEAIRIYSQAMVYEAENFASATRFQ